MKYKQWLFFALVLGLGLTFVVMAYGPQQVLSTAAAVWAKVSPSPTATPKTATADPKDKNNHTGKTPPPKPLAPMSGEDVYDGQYNTKGAP
ncbi:MAG TPA: hypothetical protein VJ302_18405 [Blastocatellia bacterium]|nr:hypothetical protein [Blastocatellia bacterium]